MQYKRILMSCLIVILILCTSVLGIGATSEATPFEQAVGVSSPTAVSNEPFVVQAGDTFEVSVSITNNPGFGAFELNVEYDPEAVTFKGITHGDMLPANGEGTYDIYSAPVDNGNGKLKFWVALPFGQVIDVAEGTVVTFNFEVNTGYHGTTSVNFTDSRWNDGIWPIDCNVTASGATVAVHDFAEEPVVTGPTCTEDGYITYTCSNPDCTDKTLVLPGEPMLDHDMADATCTAPSTCTREGCGHTEGTELGHDWAEATCTAPKTCKREGCGATEGTELGHDWADATCTALKTCKREGCGVTEGELAPHTFGEWTTVTAPTCTEKGSKERVCTATGCTAKETDEISADGHNYSTEWTIDKEATCTEAGSKSHHCLNCGDKTDVTPIDPKTHTYGDWTTVTAPTCTEKGSEKQTCVACGNVATRDIAATGHTSVACDEVEATKEKEGSTGGTKCSVCGTILTEPTVVPMLKDYTWIYILVAVVVVVAIGGGVCAYFFVVKKKGTPTAVAAEAEEEVSVEQAFAEEAKTEDNQAEEKTEE